MDEQDKVQKILEGRCILCDTRLPDHTVECEYSPYAQVQRKIDSINAELNAKIDYVTDMVKQNKITVEQFIELLDKIQTEKFKDV